MQDPQLNVHGPESECDGQSEQADGLADSYYEAFRTWLVRRRRTKAETRRLLWLGRAYDRALELVITCIERLGMRSPRLKRKHDNAVSLRSHLQKDLEYLNAVQSEES